MAVKGGLAWGEPLYPWAGIYEHDKLNNRPVFYGVVIGKFALGVVRLVPKEDAPLPNEKRKILND